VTDRLIRITTALAVVAVAVVAAIISYQNAYELVTSHGETGLTAHLIPAHGSRADLGRIDGDTKRQPSAPPRTSPGQVPGYAATWPPLSTSGASALSPPLPGPSPGTGPAHRISPPVAPHPRPDRPHRQGCLTPSDRLSSATSQLAGLRVTESKNRRS
jgi:hypothetical protein